jgi:hypothetical protein
MGNIVVVEKGAGSGGVMKHFQIHGGHRHMVGIDIKK